MIVSASYRTDIPAFYTPWLLKRLESGSVPVRNPYGGGTYIVSLAQDAVDGFVFWTRNAGPLLPHLPLIRARAPFAVQFTVTGYPRPLEPGVIDAERAIAQIRTLRRQWGPRAAVWRYDPIVFSTLTPPEWHAANFRRLAAAIRGSVDEAVVSFAHIYAKTRRNLDAAALRSRFSWFDAAEAEKRSLITRLAAEAEENGMRLTLCAQPQFQAGAAEAAACIDTERLSDIADRPVTARRKGNRPGCLCAESRDIGGYESCVQGCAYCYAVRSRAAARAHLRMHDPEDPAP